MMGCEAVTLLAPAMVARVLSVLGFSIAAATAAACDVVETPEMRRTAEMSSSRRGLLRPTLMLMLARLRSVDGSAAATACSISAVAAALRTETPESERVKVMGRSWTETDTREGSTPRRAA